MTCRSPRPPQSPPPPGTGRPIARVEAVAAVQVQRQAGDRRDRSRAGSGIASLTNPAVTPGLTGMQLKRVLLALFLSTIGLPNRNPAAHPVSHRDVLHGLLTHGRRDL